MKLRYRCPQCKKWLRHHWTDRQDAAGGALFSMELAAYFLAFVVATLGYVLEWWELLVALAIVCGGAAWFTYRLFLRNGWRYHCPTCNRVFTADYLRAQARAPQITEIAS